MTLKLTLALVMAFITAVIVGKFYVPWLRKMKAGQEIKGKRPDMAHVKVRNADHGRRHLHKRVHTCVSDCRF